MNRSIFFLAFNLISFLLASQARPETTIVNPPSKTPSSFLTFRLGLGIPNGEFAREDNGLAKEGLLLEAEFIKALGNDFFFNFSIKRHLNIIDKEPIVKDFRNLYQKQFGLTGLTITTTSTPWKVTSYMIGFGTIKPFSDNKTSFITRFALGYAGVSSPEISTVVRDQFNNGDQIILQSASSDGFAFQLGLGFKIDVSGDASFIISGDYLSTQAEFTNVATSVNGTIVGRDNLAQSISIFAISLGVAFNLN